MSMAAGAKIDLPVGSWQEVLYDFYIGVVVGAAHSLKIVARWWYFHLVVPAVRIFTGIKLDADNYRTDALDQNATVDDRKLKVVAVGYGRTGTYSLTLALEELGFPTLHTQHLYEHSGIINMWTNSIFLPSIRAKKATLGKPDLDLITSYGYRATADLPMALYFEQVLEKYPDCKFILTTRENSQVWFRSWDTLTKSISPATHFGGFFFSNVRQYSEYLRWLFSIVNKDDSYLTVPFPLPDQNEKTAIASYEEHNRRVRATIPPQQLLEYDVRQGWEPLCQFLEIGQCPESLFPKTNSARSVQVQAVSAMVFPMIIALFVVFYAFAKGFEQLTGMTVMQWADYKSRELLVSLRRSMIGHEKVDEWVPSEAPLSGSKRTQKSL